MSDVKRNLQTKINDLLKHFPVVAIIGVRQCGKTTITKQLSSKWKYFDIEKESHYNLISNDYDLFFKKYSTNIIFDEAQLLPDLFKELRHVIDNKRKIKGRFIITGSSSFELLKNISESLAGRVAIVELDTLKINEYLNQKLPPFYKLFEKKITTTSLKKLLTLKSAVTFKQTQNIFLKGGYPEPLLNNNHTYYSLWMENYFKTYLNRDIRTLFPKLNIHKYQKMIQMLSSLNGTIINRAQLARSLDTSEVTIKEYLDIAHGSFIWRNIPPFEKSKSKSIIKSPKGIFRDTGVVHYLQKTVDHDDLNFNPNVGANFESFVIKEIIAGLNATMITNWQYYYYRTKNGAEIDLIIDGLFGVLPIEIKYGTNTTKSKIPSLIHFIRENKLPLGIVINNSDTIEYITEKIIQIPVKFI